MQTLPVSRTRFGKDIVAEFMPPERPSNKVIIFATGCPGYPGGKSDVMAYYARRGYWTIIPRFRGTWESDGSFLEYPPSDDVAIVMDSLHEFVDLWSGAEHAIPNPEIYLIGGSFGGPAALLASRDARVKKAAVISSVVDWRVQEHTAEPLDLMSEYVPAAFGMAYRADASVWQKLARGGFYNPVEEKETLDASKILFIHGRGDPIVHAGPAAELAKDIGARFVLLPTNDHMGAGSSALPRIAKHIEKHFKGK